MQKEMIGGCCVCGDERGWAENPLVYCDGHGCNVAVHQACYGIVSVPTGPWFCRKCESQERAARVKCDLCPQKEGALKRTDTGGWAHVVCALYIPEVSFGDVTSMEPIQVSFVPHDRYNKVCYVCEQKSMGTKATSGACMTCNKNGCRLSFHVTCAQSDGLLCEEAGQYTDNVKYTGYCSSHFQKLKKDKDIKTIPPFKHPYILLTPEKIAERERQKGSAGTEKSRQTLNEKMKSAEKPRLSTTEKSKSAPEKTRQEKPKKGEKRSRSIEQVVSEQVVSDTTPKTESEGEESLSNVANGDVKGKFTTANFTETVIPTPTVPPSAALLEKTSVSKAKKAHSSASSSPKYGSVDHHEKQRETCSAPSSPSSVDVESVSVSSRSFHSKSDSMDKISEASSEKPNGTPSVTTETVMQTDLPPPSPKDTGPGETPPVTSPTSYENSYKEFMARYTSVPGEKSKEQGLRLARSKSDDPEKKKSKSEKRKDITKVGRPRKKYNKDLPAPLKKVRRSSSSSHSSPTKKTADHFSILNDVHGYAPHGQSNSKYPVKHLDIAALRNGQETDATIRDVFNTAGRSGILIGPQLPSPPTAQRARPQNAVHASTMEQLLERQWQQGSDFLMQQASHLDIASLISCLYQLRQENHRLEERITSLEQRRDHLLAVNARLTVPLHQGNNMYPNEENPARPQRVNNIYNHNEPNANPGHLELNSSHSSQGSANQSLNNSRSAPLQSNRISPAHASNQPPQVHNTSPHIVLATSQPTSVIQGRSTPVHSSAGQLHPGHAQITTTQMALMSSPEGSTGRASHGSPEGRSRDLTMIMRDHPGREALRHTPSAIHQHILYQQQLEQQQQQQLAYQMVHAAGQQAAAGCVIQMNGDVPTAFTHQQSTPKNSRRNEKRQHGGKDKT